MRKIGQLWYELVDFRCNLGEEHRVKWVNDFLKSHEKSDGKGK